MSHESKVKHDYPFQQKDTENESPPEGMIKTPEGEYIPIPKRNRRGRKSRRKVSHPLRDIRIARNMTLEELADISGLSPSYLSRLESGSRRLNADTINRLSTALECDPADLLSSAEKWGEKTPSGYNMHSAHSLNIGRTFSPGSFSHTNAATRAALVNQQIPLYEINPKTGKMDFNDPVCQIPAPAEIANIPGAFAFTASDNSMEPRFYQGDRLLVHPGKPLSPRATALVVTNDHQVILGEFVAWRYQSELPSEVQPANDIETPSPEEYILELKQFKGETEQKKIFINQKLISSIARVVGMVEG